MDAKTVDNQLIERATDLAAGPSVAQGWRIFEFLALAKPRVMALAVFTAIVGMSLAPDRLDPQAAVAAVLAIAAGAAASGALNMWYDADIDAVMSRTAKRPIPRGRVSRFEALVFGLVLAAFAVVVLALATNLMAAALLAGTIFFLHCGIYSVAEANDAAEHRHRRRCRSAAARGRMGCCDRRRRAPAVDAVSHHLSLDAASLLGSRAQSRQ